MELNNILNITNKTTCIYAIDAFSPYHPLPHPTIHNEVPCLYFICRYMCNSLHGGKSAYLFTDVDMGGGGV